MRAAANPGGMNEPLADDECARCGGTLHAMGVEGFRVGGTSGGWKMFFGEWAEFGEGLIDLEILACADCRRVELRVPVER